MGHPLFDQFARSIVAAAFVTPFASYGSADTPAPRELTQTIRFQPRVVNGIVTGTQPAIGLIEDFNPKHPGKCSAELIGCQTVLTAAHCICGEHSTAAECRTPGAVDPAQIKGFFPNTGIRQVESFAIPDQYDLDRSVGDIAVLRVTTPAVGVVPLQISTGSKPAPGMDALIIGFGAIEGPAEKSLAAGIKRFGRVKISECPATVPRDTNVCWAFTSGTGLPGTNSNSCFGDSGGPLLMSNNGRTIVGVLSTVTGIPPDTCLARGNEGGTATDVLAFSSFIRTAEKDDVTVGSCNGYPEVGSRGTPVIYREAVLDNQNTGRRYVINVPPGRTNVITTLTFQRELTAELHIGTPSDCGSGSGYAACFTNIVGPGELEVLVSQRSGTGMVQLTATTFCDGGCNVSARCGDGVITDGEECDDGNTTDGDGCDSNCTVSQCGNGIKAGDEQCDDGNQVNGDGCDANCTLVSCGNGIVDGTEECDEGDRVNGDGCDNNCKTSRCGNGIRAGSEECDDGNDVNTDACKNDCTKNVCGDGVVFTGEEECDDGNNTAGDGCSNCGGCAVAPRTDRTVSTEILLAAAAVTLMLLRRQRWATRRG